MSKNTETAAPKFAPAPDPAPEPAPDVLYIMDTTAQLASPLVHGSGPRTHDMMVKGRPLPFTFEYGKPLAVPFEVAIQFLKQPTFRLTDKDGNLKEYKTKPKQPHELGAGERYRLGFDETIARLDELSTTSLMLRALETPNGEAFKHSDDRHAMIAFLTEARRAFLKTAVPDSDIISPDEGFVPSFEAADEAA